MAQELGKIEKPEAEPFKTERKVYLVPLIATPTSPPADYAEILQRYWAGADDHVRRLEQSIGEVRHVYMELVARAGKDGLKLAEQISPEAAKIAAGRVERGATFEAVEDAETLAEAMDWERCLIMGLASRKASEYVSQAYHEASRRRYEMMAKRFDDSLKDGEAGLAFLSEHHRVQFPGSIRVVFVAPPALDEVHRWLRDYRARPRPPEGEEKGEQADEGKQTEQEE